MAIYQFGDHIPTIPASAFVASEAVIIGNVTLGEHVSVWPGAVLRGDNEPIVIGSRSNIQDNAVVHTDPGYPVTVGEGVVVGHQALLHGCTIGDGALVGMQAVVLNGATLGHDTLVGAGAVVTQGKIFPPRTLILGSPATAVRELTDDQIAQMHDGADWYVQRGAAYKKSLKRIG